MCNKKILILRSIKYVTQMLTFCAKIFPLLRHRPLFELSADIFTYLLTYFIEQSPSWEANRFAASQEISRILWNPKVHYRIQKFPLPVPTRTQLNPVHTHILLPEGMS
jgi:hypothetical protein